MITMNNTLKSCLRNAKEVELLYHADHSTNAGLSIKKVQAKSIFDRQYDHLLSVDGQWAYGDDAEGCEELLWFGRNGEIVITYNTRYKYLQLGV